MKVIKIKLRFVSVTTKSNKTKKSMLWCMDYKDDWIGPSPTSPFFLTPVRQPAPPFVRLHPLVSEKNNFVHEKFMCYAKKSGKFDYLCLWDCNLLLAQGEVQVEQKAIKLQKRQFHHDPRTKSANERDSYLKPVFSC